MNHRNGLHLLPQQPQAAAVQVASPMNDVQLLSLVAAQVFAPYAGHTAATNAATAERVVNLAVEIVARCYAAVSGGSFQGRLRAALDERRREADPDPAA